jgi:hypothetical protein
MDKRTLQEKAYRELKEFLLIALYLWVYFGMFTEYKRLIMAHQQIDFVAHGVALINALALGKIMLIAKAFHPGNWANEKPLIYPTLVKSAMFAVILGIFKILEDVTIGYFRGKSFSESMADLGGGSVRALLAYTVILFLVLIPFVAVGELGRVLGEGKLGALFFRPRDASTPFDEQLV